MGIFDVWVVGGGSAMKRGLVVRRRSVELRLTVSDAPLEHDAVTSARAWFTPFFAALALVLLGAACGGAHAKPAASPDAASADSSKGETANAPDGDAEPPTAESLEATHQQYLKACITSPELGTFCDCSWTVVTSVLTPKQVSGDLDAFTKQQLTTEIRKQCLNKYPESLAKAEYIGECAKAANEMTPFCTCRWAQLRKSFSIADLKTPATASTDKFNQLRKPIAKACSSKLTENSVADGFETGCNKKPGFGAFCKCAWKEVRARMSLGEIADPASGESPEFKAAMVAVGNKCQAFRPAE